MPFNGPGALVPLYALFNPRLLLPSLTVRDIRQLDFAALRRAGYRGAIFDKDNCLTLPHHDKLVPELTDAWAECQDAFGAQNLLIVSNSAGTAKDPGQLQADSVTHHLRAPVLLHSSPKPSYTCAQAVRSYFSSLPSPLAPHELVVVGDRMFTDVVLARRLSQPASVWARIAQRLRGLRGPRNEERGPLAVWTTGVWLRESMPMRHAEAQLAKAIETWVSRAATRRKMLEGRFLKTSLVATKDLTPGGEKRLSWEGWTNT
ncbi:hypothetical protein BV25DRAFT_1814552 [Artomyces pyxidatus]|uniref:Uncharacterized protein n=1 Tax=Artomyces pyxidatus TaxID=48021 RepID=A0ACB8SJS7_9AGAM|nr:hypothetical protein BV25DRAFT_1814552 [Artomyces pyxidatus]